MPTCLRFRRDLLRRRPGIWNARLSVYNIRDGMRPYALNINKTANSPPHTCQPHSHAYLPQQLQVLALRPSIHPPSRSLDIHPSIHPLCVPRQTLPKARKRCSNPRTSRRYPPCRQAGQNTRPLQDTTTTTTPRQASQRTRVPEAAAALWRRQRTQPHQQRIGPAAASSRPQTLPLLRTRLSQTRSWRSTTPA